ncbi:MAG: DUF1566 domain-containing protein, partial [Dysgonamonadaceae bacterium]|nr:DUF1566 domain-containing protein [Dysgonamonadaceae bacterium]
FYKGGVVAYVAANRRSGFVAAHKDQTRTAVWSYKRLKPATATSNAIGQGLANTTRLVQEIDALDDPGNAQYGYAAKVSADFVLNGYDDWALPSINELAQLFKVREAVGGFNLDGKYWSSSVSTAGYTYRYFFDVDSPNPQYYDLNQESPSGVRSIRNISASVAW